MTVIAEPFDHATSHVVRIGEMCIVFGKDEPKRETVLPAFGCLTCGERQVDLLEHFDDDKVCCATCWTTYNLPA